MAISQFNPVATRIGDAQLVVAMLRAASESADPSTRAKFIIAAAQIEILIELLLSTAIKTRSKRGHAPTVHP